MINDTYWKSTQQHIQEEDVVLPARASRARNMMLLFACEWGGEDKNNGRGFMEFPKYYLFRV